MVTPTSSLSMKKEKGDDNENTLGRIGVHNVVIACVPAGLMGNGPAAIVARDMQHSFPIKFGLMVGVGGGVWSKKDDIYLGDVVVSQPTGAHGGMGLWEDGKGWQVPADRTARQTTASIAARSYEI
jgi:nucleoside phosphorylase